MSAECQIVERPVIKRHKSALLRKVLFKKSRLCHWCGELTHQPIRGQPLGGKAATLDHVMSRLECRSVRQYRSVFNMVLSCLACNHRRNTEYLVSAFPPNPRKRWGIPRKVRARTLSAFDRPVASWRY